MQPELSIKVTSFNVGSPRDWQNLYTRARWKTKKQKDFVAAADFKVQQEAFYAFEHGEGISQEMVIQNMPNKIKAHLGALIREFDPHVICLQEYFFQNKLKDNAHLPIKQMLESSGYRIVGESKPGSGRIDDKAIAFKDEVFECLNIGMTFKEGLQEPAVYADLKHKASGIMIRAVTNHVSGFNGVQQKQKNTNKPAEKPFLPAHFQDRLKFFEQSERTGHGDIALDRSLNGLDQDGSPDVIIYGLDANTTSKESSNHKMERLHPKRLRLFKMYGYVTDTENRNATIMDFNDWQPRKYDYIWVKSIQNDIHVTVVDHIFQTINHPALLKDPEAIMSDHLPVLSTVKIIKDKKEGCRIS